MKSTLPTIVAALSLSSFCHAQNNPLPEIIKKGFDAYLKSGSEAAVAEWLKGSPVESEKTARLQLTGTISAIESAYGKFIGWELIRAVDLAPSSRRVYILAKYEKGPLYMSFDCFKAADWIIPTLDMNTKANAVIPPSLLSGQ